MRNNKFGAFVQVSNVSNCISVGNCVNGYNINSYQSQKIGKRSNSSDTNRLLNTQYYLVNIYNIARI